MKYNRCFSLKHRHIFYLHARLDLMEKRLLAPDWPVAAKLVALVAQAECGNYDPLHPPHQLYHQLSTIGTVDESSERPPDFLQMVASDHEKCVGMKYATAEYWLLKEVSN